MIDFSKISIVTVKNRVISKKEKKNDNEKKKREI